MPKVEVSLFSIMEYIGGRSRPLKEGEAVFKAGHIILCGLEAQNSCKIKSLCLQTSALVSQPHEITIVLDTDVKKWKCVCSCKAGMSGFCKHIIATLIYINRNEELEFVSCTDLEQKWGKEKQGIQEIYQAQPFKKFCHPNLQSKLTFSTCPRVDQENLGFISTGVADSAITTFFSRDKSKKEMMFHTTPDKDNENFAMFSKADSSQLSKFTSKGSKDEDNMTSSSGTKDENYGYTKNLLNILLNRSNEFLEGMKEEIANYNAHLKPCCQQILSFLEKSNVLEVATKYDQGSTLWAKERQLRITGSTCYSIYTFKKEDEWENKAKKIFFPKHFTNKFMEHGKKYEKEALNALRREYPNGNIITSGLIIAKIFPWLGFSPDGIIFENGVPTKLVEIKCPFIGKENDATQFLVSCDYLEKIGDKILLKEKHAHYGQVQLGMAILGLNKTDFLVYSSEKKNYLKINVDFNKEFAQNLIKQISFKYFNMLHFYCLNKD